MTKLNDDLITLKPISIFKKDYDYYVELKPETSDKTINILIGDAEATNIFLNMNRNIYKSPKPNTYQLYIDSLEKFNIRVSGLVITSLRNDYQWEGIIELINLDTQEVNLLDARPSDLINISLTDSVPLTIYKDLLTRIQRKVNNNITKTKYHNKVTSNEVLILSDDLEKMPTQKLISLLNEYINMEKYEKANEIKKIIEKRGEI